MIVVISIECKILPTLLANSIWIFYEVRFHIQHKGLLKSLSELLLKTEWKCWINHFHFLFVFHLFYFLLKSELNETPLTQHNVRMLYLEKNFLHA